jgi:predicted Zn-dependent protease
MSVAARHRVSFCHAVLGLAALGLGSCATSKVVEPSPPRTFVTDAEDAAVGQVIDRALTADKRIARLRDPLVHDYVQQVATHVMAFAMKDRPTVPWHLEILDQPRRANVFAAPGGFVYVDSGLVLAADNEAQLGAMLAHVLGHEVARQPTRALVAKYGLPSVQALAAGKNPVLAAQLAKAIAETGAIAPHTNAEEREADEYGVRYASQAGYEPRALIVLYQKLSRLQGKSPIAATLLVVHPIDSDRFTRLAELAVPGSQLDRDLGAERLKPIKDRLQARAGMPPAGM